MSEGTVATVANGGNTCLCCGARAEHYGFASMDSTGLTRSCSKEVCVACLETGCWGRDGESCFGHRLRDKPSEYHQGCGHEEAPCAPVRFADSDALLGGGEP